MNTSQKEKNLKELVLGKCWNYINDNFHKFSQPNKIKVSLALLQKSMPTEVTGMSQQIVVMNDIKKDDEPLRFNIGETTAPETFRHPEQTTTDN